ncbi:MAG: lipid kinase [Chloroflexi bacterium]|nr:lipid kinase [Chloroflexota bacterium]
MLESQELPQRAALAQNTPGREMGRVVVVVNAKSRQGEASFNNIMAELQSQGIGVVAGRAIKNPVNIKPWLEELLEKTEVDTVIVGAGDGSISALAGTLADRKIRLGVIPLGTANDFARTLNIPKDIKKVVEIIKAGYTERVDLGLSGDKCFLNVASVGLGVEVAGKMNHSLKKWIGPLAYGVAAFEAFSQRRPIHFKLTYKEAGHETIREFKALQVAVANGRYFGGGIVSAPDATLDDSLLSVTVLEEMGLLELARIIPGLLDGSYVKHPKVQHFNTTEVLVETRRTHRVNLDGEVCQRTPLRFKVHPAALEVFVPRPD